MRRLAWMAVGYALAALLWGYRWGGPTTVVLAVLGVLGLVLGSIRPRRALWGWLGAGLLLGSLWTAGYARLVTAPAAQVDDTTLRLTGTVTGWPTDLDYGNYGVELSLTGLGPLPIKGLLYTDEQGAGLAPGDRVTTIAHCHATGTAARDSYAGYLSATGVSLTAQAYGRLEGERPAHPPLSLWPVHWGRALEDSIRRAFPQPVSGLAVALVTGDKSGLDQGLEDSLRRVGLSHTVAVSGMHTAFLAGLAALLLGGSRRLTALVLIPLSLSFAAMAGGTPSVVRAAVMVILLHLAPLLNREGDGLTSLGTALLVLGLWNPLSLGQVGLQLSFGAVAGLFLWGRRIQAGLLAPFPEGVARLAPVKWLASGLAATLGASVFPVPLVALTFGSVSLISPLANLLTLWAVGLLFGMAALLGGLGVFLPQVAQLLAHPSLWLYHFLEGTVAALERIPFAALTLDSVYVRIWLVFVCLLVGLVLGMPGKKRPIVPLCAGVVTLCLALLCSSWSFWWGRGAIALLDVGQGQCALVRMGRFLCLVDCGGSENAGDRAADLLGDYGISRVDVLILTHCHDDHANGVEALLERVEVGELLLPSVSEPVPLEEAVVSAAQEAGIPVDYVEDLTQITLENGGQLTLFPPLGAGSTNEEGLSCLVSWSDFDALLTGDMGADVEQLLLETAQLPQLEVLVAGHHGSAQSTSPELLAQTRPERVLVSAGQNNPYGHPAPETLERVAAAGAQVYRTDLQGTLWVRDPRP